ncbi:hypothetical protein CPB84DRAFT_1761932 [Gymnopilus junonius]|uniref:Cyclin N-terminal domain-containing protein n=1 Tax=Gymnopilus junonius TaxID=109634 RepID=A0A9P5P0U2_GYMJU|nr:hypothetical protein CPB84DRAFT_1761932 [Gymnopilus junonius]
MASHNPTSGAPRRNFAVPQNPPPAPSKTDPYHGHETLAKLAARFITHLFACPDYPQSSSQSQAKLPYFIAYALHRTKLHSAVTFAALVLLQRLKARFPSARGSSGHRLFISAYMISSKVMCDDTYSNKSWCIVAQGMFTLREVNQMEREMCTYLDWELTVDNPILSNFENAVKNDFREDKDRRSYPNYPTTFVSKRAAKAEASKSNTPFDPNSNTTSPVPGFAGQNSPTPGTPAKASWDPNTPDTPSPTFTNATSPASSGSPATPVGGPETNPKIRGVDTSPNFGPVEGGGGQISAPHPLKPKMFAFAVPSGW